MQLVLTYASIKSRHKPKETTKLLKGTTTMAKLKNTNEAKAPKQPKDFSKAAVAIKVTALAFMALGSLYLTGLLNVSDLVAHVLGYGLMVVTLYFALSIVK